MPGEGATMYSRLQSILDHANAIVHQLMPKPISSQLPDGIATNSSREVREKSRTVADSGALSSNLSSEISRFTVNFWMEIKICNSSFALVLLRVSQRANWPKSSRSADRLFYSVLAKTA
jgi:hypothetical protein